MIKPQIKFLLRYLSANSSLSDNFIPRKIQNTKPPINAAITLECIYLQLFFSNSSTFIPFSFAFVK